MNLPSDRRPDHESADDALRSGAAIGERDARALLEVTGADRARFLHGYLTRDVQGLAAGRVAYGFFTSREGRVLADAWVGALGDALVVSLPAERASAIEQHLARFILADRVTLRLRADLSSLHAAGPEAGRRLAESGLPAPEAAGLETLTRAEASWIVLRRDLGSISGFGSGYRSRSAIVSSQRSRPRVYSSPPSASRSRVSRRVCRASASTSTTGASRRRPASKRRR